MRYNYVKVDVIQYKYINDDDGNDDDDDDVMMIMMMGM